MKISIIIPALNEALTISKTLLALQYLREKGHEIILVDGGSSDGTSDIANGLVDKIIHAVTGRAQQMNIGANYASGDVFIFLHADTLLPQSFEDNLINNINSDNQWGRFDIKLSSELFIFRVIEWFINYRSRISGIATGDQAIFATSKLFRKINGFPEIPLMEDIAICKKLKQICRPIFIRPFAITSSRRWENNGIIKTVLKMWHIRLQYALGTDPNKLARYYD